LATTLDRACKEGAAAEKAHAEKAKDYQVL
jgi:hypothetical protein